MTEGGGGEKSSGRRIVVDSSLSNIKFTYSDMLMISKFVEGVIVGKAYVNLLSISMHIQLTDSLIFSIVYSLIKILSFYKQK